MVCVVDRGTARLRTISLRSTDPHQEEAQRDGKASLWSTADDDTVCRKCPP